MMIIKAVSLKPMFRQYGGCGFFDFALTYVLFKIAHFDGDGLIFTTKITNMLLYVIHE
jgi:hypothetical protein